MLFFNCLYINKYSILVVKKYKYECILILVVKNTNIQY